MTLSDARAAFMARNGLLFFGPGPRTWTLKDGTRYTVLGHDDELGLWELRLRG